MSFLQSEQGFIDQINQLIDTLPSTINISRDVLNGTVDSLSDLDAALQRKGQRECLEPEIYLPLLAYVGEILKASVNGQWELRLHTYSKGALWEPIILLPNGESVSLINLLNEEFSPGKLCCIASAVEMLIDRLKKSQEEPASEFSRSIGGGYEFISTTSSNIKYENLSSETSCQIDSLDLPKIRERIRQWLLELIPYYRKFEFFQRECESLKESSINNIEQLENDFIRSLDKWELESFFYEFSGEDFEQPTYLDLYFLRWDMNRAWSDREINLIDLNRDVYVNTLKRWSHISKGIFLLQNVKEIWKDNDELMLIEFCYNCTDFTLRPTCNKEFIYLYLLHEINRIILSTGYQFEVLESDIIGLGTLQLVVLLSQEERIKLEQEREIYFWRNYSGLKK